MYDMNLEGAVCPRVMASMDIWLILKLLFENLFSYLSYWSSWGYIHTDMYTAAIGSGEGKDQST